MLAALLAALPWILLPVLIAWRARQSHSLDGYSPLPSARKRAPAHFPLVSIIVPARNEAHNIERCARSILSSSYPAFELLVVDDHSDDETGALARALGEREGRSRLRVVEAPPLPARWFGKQWACARGVGEARGELLCFTDADTEHAPDLLTRTVNAMHARDSHFISVVGRQRLESFWERVIQPLIFTVMLGRYGSTEHVNRSPRVWDKIANGQFILIRRDVYEVIGGHAAVRTKVAEDLALAQLAFALGHRVDLIVGIDQLSTRMYTSLAELVRGWMKNIFVAGMDSVPNTRAARAMVPILLLVPPIMMLVPPLALAGGALGVVSPPVTAWAVMTTAAQLVWWSFIYARVARVGLGYALAYPLGAAILGYICLRAIARGRRVTWKGRDYEAE